MARSVSAAGLHPVAELFPSLDEAEYASLRKSIKASGVLVPVVVDADGRIVDGRHRAAIAHDLGVDVPTQPLPEGTSAWEYAAGVNLARRNLTEQQRVALLLLAERGGQAPEVVEIRKNAKARKAQAKGAPRGAKAVSPDLEITRDGTTSEQIGALVEVSAPTVRRVETAEKVRPGSLDRIASGETTAQQVIRDATETTAAALDKAAGTPPAMKKWRVAFKAIDGNVDGSALNGSADRLTAKEIELIRDATPRLVASLESFAAAATATGLNVIKGGRA